MVIEIEESNGSESSDSDIQVIEPPTKAARSTSTSSSSSSSSSSATATTKRTCARQGAAAESGGAGGAGGVDDSDDTEPLPSPDLAAEEDEEKDNVEDEKDKEEEAGGTDGVEGDDDERDGEGASAGLLSASSSEDNGAVADGRSASLTVTAAEIVTLIHEVTGEIVRFNNEDEAIAYLQEDGALRRTRNIRQAAKPGVLAGLQAAFMDHVNSDKALKGWQIRIGDGKVGESKSSGGSSSPSVMDVDLGAGAEAGRNVVLSGGAGVEGSPQSQSTEATDPASPSAEEIEEKPPRRKPKKKRPRLAHGARLCCKLELTTHAGALIKGLLQLKAMRYGCDCRLSADGINFEEAHLAALFSNAPVLGKWLALNASSQAESGGGGAAAGSASTTLDSSSSSSTDATMTPASATDSVDDAVNNVAVDTARAKPVCSIEAGHVLIEQSASSVGPGLVTLVIPGTTAAAISKFLFLCYTGKIAIYIAEARDVFKVATALENEDVKERCERILSSLVESSNCAELLLLAEKLNGATLRSACILHMRKQFSKLPTESVLQLPAPLLARILDSDELVVDTELALLQVVELWAASRNSGSGESAGGAQPLAAEEVVAVVKAVRLTQIPMADLEDAASRMLPTIRAVPACDALIHDVLTYLDGERSASDTEKIALQVQVHSRDSKRSDWGAVRVFGQCDGMPRKSRVLEYDPLRNRWKELSHVLSPTEEAPVIVRVGTETLAINASNTAGKFATATSGGGGGGSDAEMPLTFGPTNRYDAASKRWTGSTSTGNPLSARNGLSRNGFGCAVYEGPAAETTLFAVGGATSADSDVGVGDVEMFFLARNEWITVQPLKHPRFGAAVCAYKDQMYVCGGYHRGVLRSVERFNVANRRRGVAPNMIKGRTAAAAVGVPDEGLFVFGGFGSGGEALATVEWYNPDESEWATVKPMAIARGLASAVYLQGKIYVSGGVSARGKAGVKLSAVECYDVISETWSICAELPILLRVFGGTAETAV